MFLPVNLSGCVVVNRNDDDQISGGLKLDFSGCANIDDFSFGQYEIYFEDGRSKGIPVRYIEELRLSRCWRVTFVLLSVLASLGSLDQLQAR